MRAGLRKNYAATFWFHSQMIYQLSNTELIGEQFNKKKINK